MIELWSDYGARAAIHIASASIHLSEKTGLSLLNLDDETVQLQLTSGSIRIRVKRLDDDENFEVDTPNLAVSILRPGIYRISVNESGDTTVVEDRHGMSEVTGGGSAYTLHHGDSGRFYGFDRLNADIEALSGNADDFEVWCEQRDHHEDVSISARYVSDEAIGYDDLDDYGGWRPVPEYGMVWFPNAAGGWAPYHDGHWAYIAPWGYTWVDNASWGFAPFHYGRWINAGGAWGWVPCPPRPPHVTPEYVRPVYAPALVAWVGGPHFGVGLSIGWFPLGPREVYVPSYPVSRNYINRVNVSNTTVNTTVVNNYYTTVVVNKTVNVTNVTYVNQRVPGAVVATSPQAFSSGQPVARNLVHVDDRDVAAAQVVAVTPAAVPQRAAVLGGHGASNVRPPAQVQSRTVVVKTPPPPAQPSFAQRQAAIQANGGRPLSMAEARRIAPTHAQSAAVPQVKVAPPAGKPIEQHIGQAAQAPAAAPNRVASTPLAQSQPVTRPAPAMAQQPPAKVLPNKVPAIAQDRVEEQRQLEEQHQKETAILHQQQDQERQKLQLQQQKEADQLHKQKADASKLQALQQQHQQQLQQLAQKASTATTPTGPKA